jgi:hypothetical protein
VKCPFCDDPEDTVVASRMVKQTELIRRRLNRVPPTGFAFHLQSDSVVLQMDGVR